jgi:hypothetical protein
MPQDGVPGYVKYRVLDANTGSVIVPDLPHPHSSRWTVRALQQGLPGSATLGDFTIPLFGPYDDEFGKARGPYLSLAAGQKIEGYLGDVITGSPRFSGVITKLSRPLGGGWSLSGSDTLWWLQQSHLFDGEEIGPGNTSGIIAVFPSTREVVWDGLPDTLSAGWTNPATDPQLGITAISTSTAGSYAVTSTSWSAGAEYNWQTLPTISYAAGITAWGTIVAGTSTSKAGTAEIVWLSDATVANGYMARAVMAQTGPGTALYNVSAELWGISGGVFTGLSSASNVYTGVPATFPFELGVTLYNLNDKGHICKLYINGKYSTVFGIFTDPLAHTSGRVGVRADFAAGGGTTYYSGFRFESRPGGSGTGSTPTWGVNRFGEGAVSTGTAQLERLDGTGQTNLDMLLLASSLDGFWIRKNAGAGNKGDTFDYGSAPGTDLSASIVLEEGVNILPDQTEVAPVADLYATRTRINAIPGVTSGGTVTWATPAKGEGVGGNPANAGDIVLIDTVSDLGTPGFSLLLNYAAIVAARKASPWTAIQVHALRTADIADKFRELDFIQVYIPTLGIYRQTARVVGYQFTEGQATMLVYLAQFPDKGFVQLALQRLARTGEFLTNTYTTR